MQKKVKGIHIPLIIQHDRRRKTRLNGREIKLVYLFLVKVHGEFCAICESSGKLEIDHIDEDPFHIYWKNLQLVHHNCNCKKRSKDPRKRKGRKIPIIYDFTNSNNLETNLKKAYLIRFFDFIESEFEDKDLYNYTDFLNDAAFECGFASQETIKNYIKMLCSSKANLFEKWIDDRTGIEYLKKIGSLEDFRNKYL